MDFEGEVYETSKRASLADWRGIIFLWNGVERSTVPLEVMGRCSIAGSRVSTLLSALETGEAAFNLSDPTSGRVGCGVVLWVSRWCVSLYPLLSIRNDLDLPSILAISVSKCVLVGVSTWFGRWRRERQKWSGRRMR